MKRGVLLCTLLLLISLTILEVASADTISLNSSYNLGDAYVSSSNPNKNYGSSVDFDTSNVARAYIMFNISKIPNNQKIDNASLCLYVLNTKKSQLINVSHVYVNNWNEGSGGSGGLDVSGQNYTTNITWNNQPCGVNFDNYTNCNLTVESFVNYDGVSPFIWLCWNVTQAVARSYTLSEKKVSLVFYTANLGPNSFSSKEEPASSQRPYLNITYSLADIIAPSFSNYTENPANSSSYSPGATYRFNTTINESNLNTVGIEFSGTNYTGNYISNISNIFSFNRTNLATGTYSYYWWANDTNGNYNTSGIRYYTVNKSQGQVSLLLNSQENNLIIQYPQKSNITASTLYGTVTIYRDGNDITNENSVNITRASGYYNITAISSGNQNYTSTTITRWLNITKASSSCNLIIYPSTIITYPQQVNATANCTNPEANSNLYRNNINVNSENSQNVTLGAGSYQYKVNVTESQNYTFAESTDSLTVNQAQGQISLLLNGQENNVSLTYLQQLNASASTLYGSITLYRNNIEVTSENNLNITLAADYYNYTAISSGNQNYSSATITLFANITKAFPTVTLLLNNQANNLTITYLQQLNAFASSSGGIVHLYRDNVNVDSENSQDVVLAAGYYLYKANVTSNQNFTDNADGITLYANITKINSTVFLYLNDSRSNITILQGASIEIISTLQKGQGNIKVYNNGSLIYEGASPSYNLVKFNDLSLYNITAIYQETQNYTSSSETFWTEVLTAPIVSLHYPNNTWFNYKENIYFNYTPNSGAGISACELWANWTGTWHKNQTDNNVENSQVNYFVPNLSDGYYQWAIWCNDTDGRNISSENASFGIDTIYPQINLIQPNGTKTSRTNIQASWNVSDLNLQSCWYNVYRGASIEIANTSVDCNLNSTTFNVTLDADFVFWFYANDSAGNLNSTSSIFTVSTSIVQPPPPGGVTPGGGGGSTTDTTAKDIEIKLPGSIVMRAGESKTLSITVNNQKNKFLNKCKVQGTGNFESWIIGKETKDINPEEKTSLVFELKLPLDVEARDYNTQIALMCQNYNKTTSMKVSVIKKIIELAIKNISELEKDKITFIYTLKETNGKEQQIEISYWLEDTEGNNIIQDNETVFLKASEEMEREAILKIPSGTPAGEYTLNIKAIVNGESVTDHQAVLLTKTVITGRAVIGGAGKIVSIIFMIATVLAIGFLIAKEIIKHAREKKHGYVERGGIIRIK